MAKRGASCIAPRSRAATSRWPSRPEQTRTIGGNMRRQKKFYAWGYADEDLTQDEIRPWEAEIAERYGFNGFALPPPPNPQKTTLRSPPLPLPPPLHSL